MPAEEETDEGQAQHENHSQSVRHLYPKTMEVEGEPFSLDDTFGWLLSHKNLRCLELENLSLTLENTTAGSHDQATGVNYLQTAIKKANK